MTGRPRARPSITTMPYVSAREASTTRSAARVAALEIGSGPRADELHAIGQPAVQRALAHSLHERRVALEAADAHAAPRQLPCPRQRVEQHVVALLEGDRGDAQQRPAGRGPGRELGGVDARLRDVQPVGGTARTAPAAAAVSTRWSSRRQRRTRGPPARACAPARRRRLQGRDPAACARARPCADAAPAGTSTSGAVEATSPSSSTRASSGIRSHDVGEGGDRGRVGSWPAAGYRVLVHRPTERAESAAELAVIRVAPARPAGIVDAVRYDDMHRRHSGR